MRIEKLSGDKIKVTLTASDLINLDIDINTLSPDSRELHTFLFRIMETIREETGFNPYSGQVVVEATPAQDGISILVSKLKAMPKRITREELKNGVSVKARTKRRTSPAIFYFDVFDDLCLALTELTDGELASGSLYKLGNTFCFVLNSPDKNRRGAAVMTEFASKRSAYPMQLDYIKEHGNLVAKGSRLINMAQNLRSLT